MIDTIKIITMIPINIYKQIQLCSDIKTAYNNLTGEIFYKITTDNIEGTYLSNLIVRIGQGEKYKFGDMYFLEIEGSYHKFIRGYNSHNGFYNVPFICNEIIKLISQKYNIKLPELKHWFLQRIDVAICYDLKSQYNVKSYIDNLNCCNYPKRKLKHYEGESIYITGSTTTLKIYNKMKEFFKHDRKNFKNSNFDMNKYLKEIQGFIRFECEIKKRKLKDFYEKDYIRVDEVSYKDLKKIWEKEFRKFFKSIETNLSIVQDRDLVKERLFSMYKPIRAKNLFNFYLLAIMQGLQFVKSNNSKSVYYKNIADLKKANIDIVQKIGVDLSDNRIEFNPFESDEVL